MEHSVKIVIGANYGDEGKGLMSRYFTKQFVEDGKTPVTVFHNGSAQRGHTADYEDGTRHVFHNFCAGAKDGGATFYANTFLVHPMDFCREVEELGYCPPTYCDPDCYVVTPLDLLADQIIEDYIEVNTGAREYGSCGYGTWSVTDRLLNPEYTGFNPTVLDLLYRLYTGEFESYIISMFSWVKRRLAEFNVDIELIPRWKPFLDVTGSKFRNMVLHFKQDFRFFIKHVQFATFDGIWKEAPSIIFEGAQGLLLDKDRDSIWTTTSKTGLYNPVALLEDRTDFNAEVCYVTRSYVTRHGDGPLENEVTSEDICADIQDMTNVTNDFQGRLRYARLPKVFTEAITDDCRSVLGNPKFYPTVAITHCNEYSFDGGDYRSYDPRSVIKI